MKGLGPRSSFIFQDQRERYKRTMNYALRRYVKACRKLLRAVDYELKRVLK